MINRELRRALGPNQSDYMQTSEFLTKCAKYGYRFDDPSQLTDQIVTQWISDIGNLMCLIADHRIETDTLTKDWIDDLCNIAEKSGLKRTDIAPMMADTGMVGIIVCNDCYAKNKVPLDRKYCAYATVKLWLQSLPQSA